MTANNRTWSDRELAILNKCLDRGLSSGEAAIKLPGRSSTACRDKAANIGRPFSNPIADSPLFQRNREVERDEAYVRRCIAANPFGFGKVLLREVA